MEHREDQVPKVRKVVLPSGKTIEVVYFKEAADWVEQAAREPAARASASPTAEPDQDLHVCPQCASEFVHPVEWEEAGRDSWTVLLHCPNCDACREGVFGQETVERFDEELDRGADALARDYRRLVRANMAEELERFARALRADAILPEDFGLAA